jgi:hypothetical protein
VGEGERRPVKPLLQPPRDDADHALMPARIVERERRALAGIDRLQFGERLLLHARLDFATLAVHRIELLREFPRAADIVGRQTLDAERHVRQPSRRVQTRAEREAEIEARRRARIAAGGAEQSRDARLHAARANPL